ncbi:MAG TPA: EF-hand domain-containing protein [Allosphingosinicella sp.]|nr:EF-hand domain-containing protein [Allosphingosinicella sp.]
MKKIFFAGAALAVLAAAPAVAQPGEGRSAQPQTRAHVAARVQARFASADSNRDGYVTRDEVQARTEARRGQRGERRGQRFERLDSNNDGMISRAEFEAPRARGGDRGERFADRGGRRGGGMMMARFGARAFAAMDMDRDGRVALAEMQRSALQRFDRLDSNRDGTITQSERQAARAVRMERREDRRGD